MLVSLSTQTNLGEVYFMSDEKGADSISNFCKAHDFSRAMYYILKKEGRAPQSFRVGRRELISREAAEKWRRDRESESSRTGPGVKRAAR